MNYPEVKQDDLQVGEFYWAETLASLQIVEISPSLNAKPNYMHFTRYKTWRIGETEGGKFYGPIPKPEL